METIHEAGPRNPGAVLALGTLLVLTAGVSLLPASWFGIHPQAKRYPPLNLGTLDTVQIASQNFDPTSQPSWKSFIAGSLGVQATTLQGASSSLQSDPREIANLNDPNNLTSSFSKNLYIASVALEQNGINDPAVDQQTVTQLIEQEATKIQKTTYSQNDIKVGKDDSASALKAYGNAMATTLIGFVTQKSMVDDLTSIGNFTNTNSEADLFAVAKHSQKVGGVLQKLLALAVPPSAVSIHLQVLNAVGTYGQTLQNLSRAYDDPVRATFAIKSYVDDTMNALRSFPNLASFFKSKNITFTSKDAGYVYIVGYTGE